MPSPREPASRGEPRAVDAVEVVSGSGDGPVETGDAARGLALLSRVRLAINRSRELYFVTITFACMNG